MIKRLTPVKDGAADDVASISGNDSAANKPAAAISPLTLYNTTEAAEYLRLSRSCLAKWRCSGGGPEFIPAGRKILYAQSALDSWLDSRRRRSTSGHSSYKRPHKSAEPGDSN
jgi:hypothetical protein